jgi:hypothetical protein
MVRRLGFGLLAFREPHPGAGIGFIYSPILSYPYQTFSNVLKHYQTSSTNKMFDLFDRQWLDG